jgi:hypothetical protein
MHLANLCLPMVCCMRRQCAVGRDNWPAHWWSAGSGDLFFRIKSKEVFRSNLTLAYVFDTAYASSAFRHSAALRSRLLNLLMCLPCYRRLTFCRVMCKGVFDIMDRTVCIPNRRASSGSMGRPLHVSAGGRCLQPHKPSCQLMPFALTADLTGDAMLKRLARVHGIDTRLVANTVLLAPAQSLESESVSCGPCTLQMPSDFCHGACCATATIEHWQLDCRNVHQVTDHVPCCRAASRRPRMV